MYEAVQGRSRKRVLQRVIAPMLHRPSSSTWNTSATTPTEATPAHQSPTNQSPRVSAVRMAGCLSVVMKFRVVRLAAEDPITERRIGKDDRHDD